MRSPRLLLLVCLVLFAGFARLLPHMENFAPITAVTLFAAAYLPSRTWAVALPLAARFISDVVLQNTKYVAWPNYLAEECLFVYGAMLVTAAIGFTLRSRVRPGRVLLAALAGSISFFLITNFGAWVSLTTTYDRSFSGLIDCYVAGIPFFRTTLLSDLLYSGAFFGGFALLERSVPQFRSESVAQTQTVPASTT